MPLRFEHWKDRWSEGYTVYSGKLRVGQISSATFYANDFKQGWQWVINNVMIHGIAHRGGSAERLDEAKRDMEFAWSLWVAAADLKEVSNGPPD